MVSLDVYQIKSKDHDYLFMLVCWAFIWYCYVICFSNLIQMSFWHLCLWHSLARILSAPNQVVLVWDPELACTQTHEWKSILYPLVNIYVTMGNRQSPCFMGKLHLSTGPCSIANCLSLPGGSIWSSFCRRPTDEFRTLVCRSNCQAASGGIFEPLFTTSMENGVPSRNSVCFASSKSTIQQIHQEQVSSLSKGPKPGSWLICQCWAHSKPIPSPFQARKGTKKTHLNQFSNKWFISSILNNSHRLLLGFSKRTSPFY